MFPDGGLTWEREVVNYSRDDAGTVFALLTPWYTVSTGNNRFWFYFADYSLDTRDADNVGLALLAVKPRQEAGSADQDETFHDLTVSWSEDDTGPTGIYVSTR